MKKLFTFLLIVGFLFVLTYPIKLIVSQCDFTKWDKFTLLYTFFSLWILILIASFSIMRFVEKVMEVKL